VRAFLAAYIAIVTMFLVRLLLIAFASLSTSPARMKR